MQVNAICEDGVIRFTQALQFKHRIFHLVIDLPESEIDIAATPAVAPTAEHWPHIRTPTRSNRRSPRCGIEPPAPAYRVQPSSGWRSR